METFAETELPLCLTDLSASLGLGDGCYIGQPGFLCTLLCHSQSSKWPFNHRQLPHTSTTRTNDRKQMCNSFTAIKT